VSHWDRCQLLGYQQLSSSLLPPVKCLSLSSSTGSGMLFSAGTWGLICVGEFCACLDISWIIVESLADVLSCSSCLRVCLQRFNIGVRGYESWYFGMSPHRDIQTYRRQPVCLEPLDSILVNFLVDMPTCLLEIIHWSSSKQQVIISTPGRFKPRMPKSLSKWSRITESVVSSRCS